MTSHQLLIKLLFFMICSRAFANECYVGTKTAVRTDALVKTEVSVPLCGLKAKYEDSECEYDGEIQLTAEVSPETNKPSTSSMNKYKGGVCFFRNLSVSCICYGHLCNNAIGMKEILATQLARRPPKSAQKLIMCFLFRDEISPLFGQTRLFTGPTNTHPENEGEESTHDYDDTKEATQEEHTTHPHVSDDDEKDTTRFAMDNETLVILTLAVGVAAFMLICMIIIFFVMTVVYMVKSRKVKKFIKEKEEKLERSKKAKSSSKTKSRSLTSSKRSDKDNSARRGAGGDRNRRSKSGSSKTAPSSEPDLYRDYENN
ncbi:hypothetical protein Q1695_003414 [Nippostrongylus brasiliensis]|nr:hypothetical protein Q1695_003414 [Nippostrongylus brasiliensis]